MRYVTLASGEKLPVIGQGCMGIGGGFERCEEASESHKEALELGIRMGMTFLDSAEVYADGHSEELVGEVARGRRNSLFISSKFSPKNHQYKKVIEAADRSLRRLQSDYIDLYQVHWPNPAVPIEETMRALEDLLKAGKIRYVGLSNFSAREMIAAQAALGEVPIFSNQCEYNLFDRFVELDCLPYCRSSGALLVAYSPLDKGRFANGGDQLKLLRSLAKKYGKSISQISLNWLISQPSVIAIPKSTSAAHIIENAESSDFYISAEDLADIARVCSSRPTLVPANRIRVSVSGEGGRAVYQTLDQAVDNPLGFSPSPTELAEFIKGGDALKPVRLVPTSGTSQFDYDLVEGRVRYWSWVIAHGWDVPIPAYIRVL